jgi:hypothetical protein
MKLWAMLEKLGCAVTVGMVRLIGQTSVVIGPFNYFFMIKILTINGL